jgi:gamma-glutamyl-gamma-aminobutyrate hydrolase PuuD
MSSYALFVSSLFANESRQETANYLDLRYMDFFTRAIPFEFCPIIVPNSLDYLPNYLNLSPSFIVLTGGQDFHASESRYLVEQQLLESSLCLGIPCIGICRGMQRMSNFLGHELKWNQELPIAPHPVFDTRDSESFYINSFHKWQLPQVPDLSYSPLLVDEDLNVEAFKVEAFRWLGVMWHPERPFSGNERALEWMQNEVRNLFQENSEKN